MISKKELEDYFEKFLPTEHDLLLCYSNLAKKVKDESYKVILLKLAREQEEHIVTLYKIMAAMAQEFRLKVPTKDKMSANNEETASK